MARREGYDWSQTPDEELGRMFIDEGLSGTEIAERLGHGLTHSAVMGRLSRQGIKKGRQKPVKQAHPPRPRPVRLAARRRKAALPQDPRQTALTPSSDGFERVSSGPIGLIKAMEAAKSGLCRAPLASPALPEFAYCNAKATEGSYCALHARLYYRTASSHRRTREQEAADAAS